MAALGGTEAVSASCVAMLKDTAVVGGSTDSEAPGIDCENFGTANVPPTPNGNGEVFDIADETARRASENIRTGLVVVSVAAAGAGLGTAGEGREIEGDDERRGVDGAAVAPGNHEDGRVALASFARVTPRGLLLTDSSLASDTPGEGSILIGAGAGTAGDCT